jgi:hypothetical protein
VRLSLPSQRWARLRELMPGYFPGLLLEPGLVKQSHVPCRLAMTRSLFPAPLPRLRFVRSFRSLRLSTGANVYRLPRKLEANQVLVNKLHRDGTFSNRGGHALHRAVANVASNEHAGNA